MRKDLQEKVEKIFSDEDRAIRERCTERFELRLTPSEKMQITAKAMKSGYSTSAFIRDVLLERIAKIEMI